VTPFLHSFVNHPNPWAINIFDERYSHHATIWTTGLTSIRGTTMVCRSLTHVPGSTGRKRATAVTATTSRAGYSIQITGCCRFLVPKAVRRCTNLVKQRPMVFRFYIRTWRSYSQNCFVRPGKADMKLFRCGLLPVENLLLTIRVSNSTVAPRPVP
jgi:hypothetical protein